MSVAEPPFTRPPRVAKEPPPRLAASARIEALARELRDDAGALARFWAAVEREGTPLVEELPGAPGERVVTFLWRDRPGRETRAVVLLANKLTDPSVWERSVLERLPGTDLWHRSYRLDARWRATYQLAADDGSAPPEQAAVGPASRWAGLAAQAGPDPLNRRSFPGRDGAAALSVAELPLAPPQPWSAPREGVPRGRLHVERLSSAALDGERAVWVHEPALREPPASGLGLLVLLDGDDWAGRLGAATILDNLHADGAVAPLLTVMPAAPPTLPRWRELGCHAPFLAFLREELVPWARARWRLASGPGRVVVAGQSLGGLTALWAAQQAPATFGAALSLSASLWWPLDGREQGLVERLAAAPPRHVRLHLEVGSEEWILLAPHRRLRDALGAAGLPPSYVEYAGGHDAICWRGGLADGLVALAGADRR